MATNTPDPSKKFQLLDWAFVSAVALFGLLGTLHIAFGLRSVFGLLKEDKAADWAQAILAALSILAGALGIAWQVRRQALAKKNDERLEHLRKLRLLEASILELRVKLAEFRLHTVSPSPQLVQCLRFALTRCEKLDAIPLYDFPHAEMLLDVLPLVELYKAFCAELLRPGAAITPGHIAASRKLTKHLGDAEYWVNAEIIGHKGDSISASRILDIGVPWKMHIRSYGWWQARYPEHTPKLEAVEGPPTRLAIFLGLPNASELP